MSGNTVKIPSGLFAYKLFLLFSRLISNNMNNYNYELTME